MEGERERKGDVEGPPHNCPEQASLFEPENCFERCKKRRGKVRREG